MINSRSFLRFSLAALALLPMVLAGCGRPPTATVSGKVTVKGKDPLPGGSIGFHLASDPTQMAGGLINPDGTFQVTGVPVGECKVVISNNNLNPAGKAGAPAGGGLGDQPPSKPITPPKGETQLPKYVKIEATFAKAESTPLKHTVNMGDNKDVNFDVK